MAEAETKEAHTPGPWAWMGGPHGLYLATTHSGRQYVMGFQRMGLQSAQPVFRVNHRLVPASELVEFEVGSGTARGFAQGRADDTVYRYDVSAIDNPDARLIAAAPTMLDVLRKAEDELRRCGLDCVDSDERTDTLLTEIRAAIQRAEA